MATASDAQRTLYIVTHNVIGPKWRSLLVGTERAKENCLDEAARIIDRKEDDVRCYPLPGRGFQTRIGRASLTARIHWTGLPAGVA